MIEIQTLIVYILLFVVMYVLAINTAATKSMKYIVAALMIYAFVFGLRYGVGTDFFNYLYNYSQVLRGFRGVNYEFGFYFMTSVMAGVGLPSWVYFGLIAFIQVFFVFYAEKDNKNIIPLLVFTFMFSCTWLTFSNGLRQVLAFCFFVYSLKLLDEKKVLSHYLMLILAFSMHKSALALFLVYPFFQIRTRDKRLDKAYGQESPGRVFLQLGVLAMALVIGRVGLVNQYLGFLDKLLALAGYVDYLDNESLHNLVLKSENVSIGIGYVVNLAINMILIIQSRWTKSYMKSKRISIMYDLFYLGIIIHYAFQASQIINRMNMYLYTFSFIFGAHTLYQLKKRGQQWWFFLLAGLYILLFVGFLYKMTDNTSAFFFLWQSDICPIRPWFCQ